MERREWEYVETLHTAEVIAGELVIRPHWRGLQMNADIRATMKSIADDHNQHTTLVEQRDLLASALSQIRNEAESTHPDNLFAAWVARECQAALATVEQGHGELAGGGSES